MIAKVQSANRDKRNGAALAASRGLPHAGVDPMLAPELADASAEPRLSPDFTRVPVHGSTGVMLVRQPDPAAPVPAVPPAVEAGLRSPGRPLDPGTRAVMEPRFGHDFSQVRVHTDARAAESARALNALAYTVGHDVVFGAGQYAPQTSRGQQVVTHELTHVVQQAGNPRDAELKVGASRDSAEMEADRMASGAGAPGIQHRGLTTRLQRYEAGEHAQFGETGDVLRAYVGNRTFTYKVKPGETLPKIAARFNLSVPALREANSDKLRKWPKAEPGPGKGAGANVVEGFNAGEEITIPPVVNEFTQQALKTKELVFTVNGVKLEYGVGIAMADLYEDVTQMLNAPASELEALAALIRKEKSGTPVTTAEWDAATGGRYHRLAEQNEAHFAPANPKLAAAASVPHGADHKSEWEKYHRLALGKSQAGLKDEALAINAFADHFLTDAFAGGHLVNKRDVMELFKGQLTTDTKGKFIGDAKAFFDNVARIAFTGAVKTAFSAHETVASYNMSGEEDPDGHFHPSINSTDRFSSLLQGIQKKEPDVLANAIAKAVHDSLNTEPKGVPVENARGDKWNLPGDTTLARDAALNTTPRSLEITRRAVAQSQLNILDAFKIAGAIDYPGAYKKVWDYVPYPTAAGETVVKAKVASGTDPKQASLVSAVVALINGNHPLILRELIARKILRHT